MLNLIQGFNMENFISDINYKLLRAGTDEIADQAKAVVNSVMYVLGTIRRQRVNRPSFGSYLYSMLFNEYSGKTANDIKVEIYQSISDGYNGLIGLVGCPFNNINVYVIGNDKFQVELNLTLLTISSTTVTINFTLNKP